MTHPTRPDLDAIENEAHSTGYAESSRVIRLIEWARHLESLPQAPAPAPSPDLLEALRLPLLAIIQSVQAQGVHPEIATDRVILRLRAALPTGADPASRAADPCGFCCTLEEMGRGGACSCVCHASTGNLRYRASLALCVAALKRIRLRVAAWEDQDAKALADGIKTLETPTPSSGSEGADPAKGGN